MPQVCRGVACLLVAVSHGAALIDRWFGVKPMLGLTDFGPSGVHMFFVISGLIIYHAHSRELDDVSKAPRYLLKRIVRIYPFYWIVFLLLGGRKVFSGRMEISDFFSNALLFSSSKSLVVAVSWTLAYEMIFYGLFVAFLVKRTLGVAVFAAWFGLIALNHRQPFTESIWLDLINILFMMGLLASVTLIAMRSRLVTRHRDWIGIASLAAGTTLFAYTAGYYLSLPVERQLQLWKSGSLTLGFGAGSALLLFASISDRVEAFLKRRTLMLRIGDASYSIYLVHFYFQTRAMSAIRSLEWVTPGEQTQASALLMLAVVMVVSVGAGMLIHMLVEKPVLARSRQWLGLGRGRMERAALS